MAEHKTFIVYKNWRSLVAFLDDESAGQLFKALFAFVCDGEFKEFENSALTGILQTMTETITADEQKYMDRCERNRKNRAGKKHVEVKK